MQTFAQVAFGGLTMGAIYALVALGFTLTVAAAGIINFGYGELVTYGAYLGVTFAVFVGMPLWLALVATVAATAILGFLFQIAVFDPLEGQHFLTIVGGTIGVGIALQNAATLIWGPYPLVLPPFFGIGGINLAGIVVFPHAIIIIAATAILIAVLQVALTRTDVGLRLQATAQDVPAARLMGIRIRRMRTIAYCLAGALAGFAGFLVAPIVVATTGMGFTLMLKGFAATVLGGWGSLKGAVYGGLLVGLMEALGATYISSDYKDVVAFGLIVLVLIVRPRGLFPERVAEKL
jgi:branched-chain amino acid transport system permease protein